MMAPVMTASGEAGVFLHTAARGVDRSNCTLWVFVCARVCICVTHLHESLQNSEKALNLLGLKLQVLMSHHMDA